MYQIMTIAYSEFSPVCFTGYDSQHCARELIHEISNSIREEISKLVADATAFSILSDGSQARKTGSEKELIFIRVMKNGTPCKGQSFSMY